MSGDDKYEFKRLQAILDGDGTEIREQYIFAGLLLTIFERFKQYTIHQVDGFFSSHVVIKDGDIKYTRGEAFKELIKERGAGEPGQHNNKEFRAALRWFHDLNAIDAEELSLIERTYNLRNEIGHELYLIIADDRKKPIHIADVVMTFGIYVKIVRWWFKEVEAATDPDMTEEGYDAIDWDNVETSETVFLRAILQKTLAGNPKWEEIQEWVSQAKQDAAPP